MTIEFEDRYGGRPPSWLRGCHGDCEAMGYVPVWRAGFDGRERSDDEIVAIGDPLDEEIAAWERAHAESPHECDGWHFIPCPDCGGSGRASWLTTIARLPRWFVRGARFLPQARSVSEDD